MPAKRQNFHGGMWDKDDESIQREDGKGNSTQTHFLYTRFALALDFIYVAIRQFYERGIFFRNK